MNTDKSIVDKVKQMGKSGTMPAPIAKLLGFEVTRAEEGSVTIELAVDESMHNPMGTLHGGILGDIADAAMGYAFSTTLAENQLFTSMDIKVNFLKPVFTTTLTATSKLIKRGSTVGLLECNIVDKSGALVAYATSTCMVLEGNPDGKRAEKK